MHSPSGVCIRQSTLACVITYTYFWVGRYNIIIFLGREICNGCNMGARDLPDMYARSPRAAGPRDEGIHIRQITSAHVTSNMYHFRAWASAKQLKPDTYVC